MTFTNFYCNISLIYIFLYLQILFDLKGLKNKIVLMDDLLKKIDKIEEEEENLEENAHSLNIFLHLSLWAWSGIGTIYFSYELNIPLLVLFGLIPLFSMLQSYSFSHIKSIKEKFNLTFISYTLYIIIFVNIFLLGGKFSLL